MHLPPSRGRCFNMAEAIISRRGYNASGKPELRTETITGSTNWVVPKYIGNVSVRIFGAGASTYMSGGSGWMNNADFNNLTVGQSIQITIGQGYNASSGGTTSFGTYLSANGGSGQSGGAGGPGGTGYQFGGGVGGDGGTWGGGGGGYAVGNTYKKCSGGNGGTYGGGGGGCPMVSYRYSRAADGIGGNGGLYGGGGGGASALRFYYNGIEAINDHGNRGIGGTYGGNGGNNKYTAENGTNTMSNSSVQSNLRGYGIRGNNTVHIFYVVNNSSSYLNNQYNINTGTGGGGFGGNGGDVLRYTTNVLNSNYYTSCIGMSGGGGGGYGGNGGRGWIAITSADYGVGYVGGGGGGYGGDGNGGAGGISVDSAINVIQFKYGGGGGYFSSAWGGAGGGYYNYCHGAQGGMPDSYSYGSGGWWNSNGKNSLPKNGVCIIQYYQ